MKFVKLLFSAAPCVAFADELSLQDLIRSKIGEEVAPLSCEERCESGYNRGARTCRKWSRGQKNLDACLEKVNRTKEICLSNKICGMPGQMCQIFGTSCRNPDPWCLVTDGKTNYEECCQGRGDFGGECPQKKSDESSVGIAKTRCVKKPPKNQGTPHGCKTFSKCQELTPAATYFGLTNPGACHSENKAYINGGKNDISLKHAECYTISGSLASGLEDYQNCGNGAAAMGNIRGMLLTWKVGRQHN